MFELKLSEEDRIKLKSIVEKNIGKEYFVDLEESPPSALCPKLCYCIHKKDIIRGAPIVGKIWKNDHRVEVIKEEFTTIAQNIADELKKEGIESRMVLSKTIKNKKKLEELKKTIENHIGKGYYVIFKDIRSWEEETITYGVYRKTFWNWYSSDPLSAEIWTDDFRIVIKEESFEKQANELANYLKKEGIEAKVEPDFVIKQKRASKQN